MGKKATIGAQITLDGEKQFKAALTEINAGLRVNASEMKKITAQYANSSDSVEAFTAKGEALEAQIVAQEDKVKTLEAALNKVGGQYGSSSKEAMEWLTRLNNAEAELISLNNELEKNQKQLQDAADKMKGFGNGAENSGTKIKSAGSSAKSSFTSMQVEIDKLGESGEASFGDIIDTISEMAGSTGPAADIMKTALSGGPYLAAGALAVAIAQIGVAAHDIAKEVETSAAKMRISLGLTEEAADDAMESVRDIYQKGITKDKETVQEALTNVMRLMDLEGEAAEDAANKIIAMGADSRETARAAGILMKQLGTSAEEALDIIATGLQGSANDGDDFLQTLTNFAPAFQRMGYSAEEFLTKLEAGMDAGAYSADAAADVIKEFYNKAASGDTAFAEAIQRLGFNADSTINTLISGGDRAKQKFEDVAHRLGNISDETKQAQIASALFGSQWENVGTKATLAMSNTTQGIIDTTGTAQKQLEILTNTTEATEEKANRLFEGLAEDASQYAQHPFTSGTVWDFLTNSFKEINEAWKPEYENTGQAMIDGVKQGWASGEEELYKQVEGTAKEANRRFNEAAEIHSPSRLFERESGAQMAAGVGVGWNKGMEKVQRDIERSARQMGRAYGEPPAVPSPVLSSAAPSAVPSRAAASSSGGDVYNVTIDAKNVKEFTDIVNLAKGARQARRAR